MENTGDQRVLSICVLLSYPRFHHKMTMDPFLGGLRLYERN